MKKLVLIFLLSIVSLANFAQKDSATKVVKIKKDTGSIKPKPIIVTKKIISKSDSLRRVFKTDSIRKAFKSDSIRRAIKLDSTKKIIVIDSTLIKDSLAKAVAITDSLAKDSIQKAQVKLLPKKITSDTSTYKSITHNAYLPFDKKGIFMLQQLKPANNKDLLFYVLAFVVFFLGFIKVVFPKYFQNIFTIFFQTSFRQKQTREQLLQDNFPSLLMNVLFILSGGIYIGLLVSGQGYIPQLPLWQLLLYSLGLLAIVYLSKYLFLQFSGWVFNVKDAMSSYIFIVFLVNKIMGVLLIPFLLLLAFSVGSILQVTVTVSLIAVAGFFLYRYLVSLGTINKNLKVNPLHFFLYLCAVEVLPLLIIYKALFNFIGKSI